MAFNEKTLYIVEGALPPPEKPLRAGLIAERSGYAPATVKDALRELVRRKRAVAIGEGHKRTYAQAPR